MKTAGVVVVVVLVVAGGTLAGLAQQQTAKKPPPVDDNFMLAKLEHSKSVLEGLTVENYDLIARHSQAMELLSYERGWQVIQTEEYAQRSAEFRRSISALTAAAKAKNLDGATVAYVDATLKCVECHKYVRRIRHAGLDNIGGASRIAQRTPAPEKPL